MSFLRATEQAHELLGPRIRSGDVVVDATVGNGHDTLFLANRVGADGRVIGFDIQRVAIEATRERLANAGVLERVDLRLASHETIADLEGPFRVVMFNLGYLPGGDKEKVTRTETTLAAMQFALDRLTAHGLLTIVAYPGHDGGAEEAIAVLDFCESLDREYFSVTHFPVSDQASNPPFLIAIERRLTQPC